MSGRIAAAGLALLLLPWCALEARAQTGANVLIVYNTAVEGSRRIAERYAERRQVPAEQSLGVTTVTTDEISRPDFERQIQSPIAGWLNQQQAQDRILYIVLAKGLPLRIAGTIGRSGTTASVDSELTLLYRRMTGAFVPPTGSVENPYFAAKGTGDGAVRFSHATADIFLVTRLDGFTIADALGLIERASSPVNDGRILLDQRAGLADVPNGWLAAAAKALEAGGFADRVTFEATSRVIDHEAKVLGYYSWGSNDPAQTARRPDLQFVPGAIAGMFLSSDARTFVEPPATWKPGGFQGSSVFFAGSPQSLTGDLIRAGVTGVSGQVAEPYLDSSVRPDILFPAYLSGLNLAESFYRAMPALSWQTVVVGDPLCAPFTRAAVATEELNPAIDPDTELPARFSARRIAATEVKTGNRAALLKVILAISRQSRGNTSGARDAFEQALALDDSLTDPLRLLATTYEQLEEFDKAEAAYRKLLARDQNDTVALNNLAYSLAVRRHKPAEALPLAERADLLAPRSAVIYDTLGYIKHLLGDHAEGARLLVVAAQALPSNVDVQLHAAVALAAAGRLDDATRVLKAVAALDPKVVERPEYREAQSKLRR
ncbi:MAG: TIGR03790 family protein [Vicinamibacterales bacterium]